MNMAVDEALLRTAAKPVLRFYGWRRSSLSFGYFVRFSDVAAEEKQRDIVRRWTGGGIVFHGTDLTYSIILPRAYVAELPSPRVAYSGIHGAIQEALSEHLDVALARKDAPRISEACFANAVTADVLLSGRKIAGAAQRRTRTGVLHQGSIQYEGLPSSFPNTFAAALCARFETTALDRELLQLAENLTEQKYGTADWLRQR